MATLIRDYLRIKASPIFGIILANFSRKSRGQYAPGRYSSLNFPEKLVQKNPKINRSLIRRQSLRFLLCLLPLLALKEGWAIEKEPYCFFIPPKKWVLADPLSLSSRVKIGFLYKAKSGFCPSLNLAIEKTDVSLSDYIEAVKKIHLSDRNNRWRHLGIFSTKSGNATLTEIDTTTEWGAVRLLQLILVKDAHAYVITAAAKKDDFYDYYENFQKAFASLTVTDDLISCISQENKKEILIQKVKQLKESKQTSKEEEFQKNHWLLFQNWLIKDFTDMGAHWQTLFLQMIDQEL